MIPFGSQPGLISFNGDFVLFAYLLALGKFFNIIAALDTGSSFEGMGASREALYSLLAEPAFFILMGSFALLTGHSSFQGIFGALHFGSYISYAVGVLAAFVIIIIALIENSRMPIDDPGQKDSLHRDPIYTREEIAAIVDFVESFGAPGPPIPTVDLARANLSAGRDLYQANCAACHSTTGAGGALATGKPGIVNGFVLSSQRGLVAPPLLKSTPTQVAEAMRTGPPGMPVFGPGAFPDEQVDSIARYVVYLQEIKNPGGLELGRIGPVAEGAVGWLVGLASLLLLTRWIGTSLSSHRAHGSGGHG